MTGLDTSFKVKLKCHLSQKSHSWSLQSDGPCLLQPPRALLSMGINVLRPLVGWDYAAGGRGLFFLDLGLHWRSPPQTGPSPQQGSIALKGIKAAESRVRG